MPGVGSHERSTLPPRGGGPSPSAAAAAAPVRSTGELADTAWRLVKLQFGPIAATVADGSIIEFEPDASARWRARFG